MFCVKEFFRDLEKSQLSHQQPKGSLKAGGSHTIFLIVGKVPRKKQHININSSSDILSVLDYFLAWIFGKGWTIQKYNG